MQPHRLDVQRRPIADQPREDDAEDRRVLAVGAPAVRRSVTSTATSTDASSGECAFCRMTPYWPRSSTVLSLVRSMLISVFLKMPNRYSRPMMGAGVDAEAVAGQAVGTRVATERTREAMRDAKRALEFRQAERRRQRDQREIRFFELEHRIVGRGRRRRCRRGRILSKRSGGSTGRRARRRRTDGSVDASWIPHYARQVPRSTGGFLTRFACIPAAGLPAA